MKQWKRAGAVLLAAAMLTAPAAAAATPLDAPSPVLAFTETNYKDVLSTLSASEQDRLFQRLLCSITTSYIDQSGYYDAQNSSEDAILDCLAWMQLCTHFPFEEYGYAENSQDYLHPKRFSKASFDQLTNELFGRTLTFSTHTVSSIPAENDVPNSYQTYLYNGTVYLFTPQAGDVENERAVPTHLYQISGSLYCATFTMYSWYLDDVNNQTADGNYQAIVRRSGDTWTLLYLSKKNTTISDATLAAFNQPSDWASAEVSAALTAGLGENLSGSPGWQDQATRLQFAQLAVQMVEASTGQPLDAAPASTFGDCSDLSVLKACQAGIVNGTDVGVFSPDGKLDRETLATMLWRAAEYVKKQTGSSSLTAGGSLSGYTDASSVSDWALAAVTALNANGILQGQGATTLAPKGACTVEQSVILAYRTLLKLS